METKNHLGETKDEKDERLSSALCLVKHLPNETKKDDLEQLFKEFGHIEDIQVVQSKQCAYVTFKVRPLPFSPFTRNGPIPKR